MDLKERLNLSGDLLDLRLFAMGSRRSRLRRSSSLHSLLW